MTDKPTERPDVDGLLDEDDSDENSTQSKTPPFDDPIPSPSIGHLTAQDDGLQIGREENVLHAFLQPSQRDNVEVGDYVRIPYYRPDQGDTDVSEMLLASVETVRYDPRGNMRDQTATSAEKFGEDNYKCKAILSPIATIKHDDKELESKFVNRPPLPTLKIGQVETREFLRCGLEIPSDGIYLGDMGVNGQRIPSAENPLEYFLYNPNVTDGTENDGEASIFRHVLVAGSTGTGKTHTSKNILRQFAKCKKYKIDAPPEEDGDNDVRERRLNLTIIDPEEEYTEMAEDPTDIDAVQEAIDSRQGVEYGGIADNSVDTDFKVFYPAVSHNTQPPSVDAPVQEFGIPFELVEEHKEVMMPADPQGTTRQAISEMLGDYFAERRRNNAKPRYEDFNDWVQEENQAARYEERFTESAYGAAVRRLTYSTYSNVFDQGPTNLTDITKEMFAPGQVTVITTGHLKGEGESFVIQALLSHIVENKISSDVEHSHIKGTPLVLALDEAHEYLTEPETTREHYIVGKFRQAARRGRKDKFGLYFISQNPEDIDGETRNQLNTKIYLRLEGRVAKSGDVFIPRQYENQISSFDKGQMVVTQPDVRDVEVKGLPVCLTKHTN